VPTTPPPPTPAPCRQSLASPARASPRGPLPRPGPTPSRALALGTSPGFVAGRNTVVYPLAAALPAVPLYVGTRLQQKRIARPSSWPPTAACRARGRPRPSSTVSPAARCTGPGAPVSRPSTTTHPGRPARPAATPPSLCRLSSPLTASTAPRNLGRLRLSSGFLSLPLGPLVPGPHAGPSSPVVAPLSASACLACPGPYLSSAANLGPHLGPLPGGRLFVAVPGTRRRHTSPRPGSGPPPAVPCPLHSEGRACPSSSARTSTSLVSIPSPPAPNP